jgi:molecular chaperone DnaK
MVHGAEKNLKEYGDKVSEADRKAIETAIADLKTALGGEDADAIKQKMEALSQVSMKLGEAMYKASQEQAAAGGGDAGPDAGGGQGGGSSKANDGVVDADFEEVDPDKDKGKKAG